MEKTSKRGKIPQSDWPSIMARYEAGETLASIARTYLCSPPAISYVVSRSRARQPAGKTTPQLPISPQPSVGTEPHWINNAAEVPDNAAEQPLAEPVATSIPVASPTLETISQGMPNYEANSAVGANAATDGSATDAEVSSETLPDSAHLAATPLAAVRAEERTAAEAGGWSRNSGGHQENPHNAAHGAATTLVRAAPQNYVAPPGHPSAGQNHGVPVNADKRRTLHLSLGNGGTGGNQEIGAHTNGLHGNGPNGGNTDSGSSAASAQSAERSHSANNGYSSPSIATEYRDSDRDGGKDGFTESRRAPYPDAPQRAAGEPRKDGNGNFIDRELRARVDGDIAAFLAAFDVALAEDTQETRLGLREATDRLLRAGARTRIELERLEARLPLSSRENTARSEPAWRYR
ncbi:MAG TPA: hypothetical protein VHY35_16455 [Stellaceae bacterium]|jgi:hypothetical protein|nr:hypothetical protein [Stellaceae bacterium]